VGGLLLTTAARAQPAAFEFSFSNPGARSMGLGGAFAALADDATAAFANPAGLVQLGRGEISAELRAWNHSTPFVSGGRVAGEPTGILLDDTAGLRQDRSSETTAAVSFLSGVIPGERWSLALYRHQAADYEFCGETQGLFAGPPDDPVRLMDTRRTVDLRIVTYGISAGIRLSDRVSLGAGVAHHEGKLDAAAEYYLPLDATLPQGSFGPNIYAPEARFVTSRIVMDDSNWAFNAGFLWQFADRWSLGGFYREAPSFRLWLGATAGPAFDPSVEEGTVLSKIAARIDFPDVYGLGLAYESPGGAFGVSIEWDHVTYSTILESIDSDRLDTGDSRLEDGDELRLGFEFLLLRSTPIVALRWGVWRDPDHRIEYIGNDPLSRALFPRASAETHAALGVGVAFHDFQLDLAADFSDPETTATVSGIYKF